MSGGNTKLFTVFVPVPQECMAQVIGKRGIYINQIKQETNTKIYFCNEGDRWGRGTGFTVTGGKANCEDAREAIQHRAESARITISELVPQQFVGLLIGKGNDNFRRIEEECDVKITWPNFSGTEKHEIFYIKGSRVNCERAREMLKGNIEKWKTYKVNRKTATEAVSCSRNDSKTEKRNFFIPKEFIGLINGAKGHTIAKLRTKSGAMILFSAGSSSRPEGEMATVMVEGSSENCDKAEMLIKDKISGVIVNRMREELGGYVQFACFSCTDVKNEFQLVKSGNDSSGRSKYRVESDNYQTKDELFSRQTIASVKCHLSKSLQTLHELKDDKELTVDLWCNFCKIVLENVQEDEANETVTGEYINRRIGNICSADDKETYWRASFGEFVDPSEVNDGTLPESNNSEDEFLMHDQTLWRYDYGFVSPTGLEIRLKVWQGLPEERNEPPDQVKNILQQVFFKSEEGNEVKAWLCYPSTTVVKGNIMVPFSKYDCRMKLRAGPRRVAKNNVKQEELNILADYLSHCTIDRINHKLVLPDDKIPKCEDFLCNFYREANEKTFHVDLDNERYSVMVFDEKGWDSTLTQKTDKKEFGIRVMMDSWSKALLSPERDWEPEEILSKLDNYMDFLSVLYDHLFTN